MEERYMRELITVSVDSGTRLLTISTEGKDAQQANDIMDAMLKRFAQLYDVIESTVGEHETTQVSLSSTTTVLTSLRDQQQNTRDNMIQLQNNLTDLQSNHELLEQSIQTADKDFAATEKPKRSEGCGQLRCEICCDRLPAGSRTGGRRYCMQFPGGRKGLRGR